MSVEELVKRLRKAGFRSAADKLEELAAENEATRQDIDRYIQINTDLLAENERLRQALTAAEQAEPAPAALEPAEPEVVCVGCEGKPSLGNSPCAVCGKQAAEPTTDAEPFCWLPTTTAKWLEEYDGPACGTETVAYNQPLKSDGGAPLFTHQPESLPKSVLERVERMVMEDREGKFNAVGVIQLLKREFEQ